ncbi:MAG: NADH-quinone oxidoreductase subunit M [Acidobacteriota bacterium]|nr:MAG: NADH-quinone oxidoreductase subunit M [Acidobacteriota bacterium]
MLASENILTTLLLIPGLGSLILAFIPGKNHGLIRNLALVITLVTFICSVPLVLDFDASTADMQFVKNIEWIEAGGFSIRYNVGIDGISLFLIVLTTFLMPLSVLGSWSIQKNVKAYMILMLLLEVGMLGVFMSLDLVLFYFFWEAQLIPMYFLIGIWGGARRIYAAVKFFLYTAFGSLLMLAALIALYFFNGGNSFDIVQLTERLANGAVVLAPMAEILLFLAFFLAFSIKVPLFPFHTWLPDAHVEAPTAGSVILAGVLLKMGTYGLLRFCLPMFPTAAVKLAPVICVLAIIGIIYGALVAMVQPDVKKLVAYSSVSHLGFVVLGIFAFNMQAIGGATYQMLNHGISTGALFLLVGIIYDRRHTRQIADFGGIAHRMPIFATMFLIIALSSIGMPGLNGFVGEFLVLQGTFLMSRTYAVFAASAVILAAIYMLWMYQRVFMGRIENEKNMTLQDMTPREIIMILPLILMAIWMGVASPSFLNKMDVSIQKVVDRIEDVRTDEVYRVEQEQGDALSPVGLMTTSELTK